MCDGPVQYVGDTVNNMELLPSLGRPKSTIVEVEMPYATKLLAQEQETFLNMSMRFITTRGVECLRPLNKLYPIEEVNEVELKVREFDEIVAPPYVETSPLTKLTAEELVSLQESVKELSEQPQVNLDEELRDPDFEEEAEAVPQNIVLNIGTDGMGFNATNTLNTGLNTGQNAAFNINIVPNGQQPPQQQPPQQPPQQQEGGSYDKVVSIAPVPGGAPIIAVDTSEQAMERDGIDIGGGRLLRRRFQGGQSQMPAPNTMGPTQGQNSIGLLTITKLE
jgi:hypothetical protein